MCSRYGIQSRRRGGLYRPSHAVWHASTNRVPSNEPEELVASGRDKLYSAAALSGIIGCQQRDALVVVGTTGAAISINEIFPLEERP